MYPTKLKKHFRIYLKTCVCHSLNKVEALIEEAGYIVRYERGSFQSGFCILEDKKVVVLNKFLPLEGRINTLIELNDDTYNAE